MKNLKNTLLIVFTLLMSLTTSAQTIQSLTVSPANPTTSDTINIFADCQFFSGGCSEYSQTFFINGTQIFASALHCLGPLAVICDYTDTITLNTLPAGAYTFYFQLDAGFGPSPCTPGIVPGTTDSISFIISPAVGVSEYIAQDAVSVFPNPFSNEFQLTGIETENYPLQLEIFSSEGKLVKRASIPDVNTNITVGDLPAAVYQIRIRKNNGEQFIIPALKK